VGELMSDEMVLTLEAFNAVGTADKSTKVEPRLIMRFDVSCQVLP